MGFNEITFKEAREQLDKCDCYYWDTCGRCMVAAAKLNAWFLVHPKPAGFYDGV